MRSAARWLALAMLRAKLLAATLATITPVRPAIAQVLDPIQYGVFKPSDLTYGCTGPCACPQVSTGPLAGTFTFYRTGVDPLYTHYALLNIVWRYPVPGTGKTAIITGHGTYDIGGEFALTQRMQLDVTTDGVLQQHFDSGLVPVRAPFPSIEIDVHAPMNVCVDSILHVIAGPQGTESVPPSGPAMRLTASPNPTRAGADVVLTLPTAEAGEVMVLNVAGQSVARLAHGMFPAGESHWHWDGRTASGTDAGAGVFWVRARIGAQTVTQGFVRFR
jgi:hypothetical protein